MKKYVIASLLLTSGLAYGQSCSTLPAGASALGFGTQLFYDAPTENDVSVTDEDTTSKWYPGSYSDSISSNLAKRKLLSTKDGMLAISLDGGVSSETHSSKAGGLPLLSGSKGFYVEVAMSLSSNNNDHFTGIFLETAEHDLHKSDHLSSDPAGYERWTELDISEAGYGAGSLSTYINWEGTYPHYSSKVLNDYGHDEAQDWTTEHRYGLSYNPETNVLQYYIDDKPTWKVTATGSVIKDFHYYLVMEASSHGSHVPYEMYIHYVRAYTK